MYYDPLAPKPAASGSSCPLCSDQNNGDSMQPENPNGNQNGGGQNDGTISPPDNRPPQSEPPMSLPSDTIDPNLLSLAMAFVPYQAWGTPYANDVGLSRGTIFPGLDKPFLGERPLSKPTSRWEV